MFEGIKKIWSFNSGLATGFVVHTDSSEIHEIQMIQTLKSGSKVNVQLLKKLNGAEAKSFRYNDNNHPIFINIDGNVVIHKYFPNTLQINDIYNQLPVKNIKDFFIQIQPTGDGYICSIIRHDQINITLEKLGIEKDQLADISIGPYHLLDFTQILDLKQVEFFEPEFPFNKSSLTYFNSEEANEKILTLENEKIPLRLIPAYALIISFYINLDRTAVYKGISIKDIRYDLNHYANSVKTFKFVLIAFISILLLNILAYSKLKTTVDSNQIEITNSLNLKENLDQLQHKVSDMEKMLKSVHQNTFHNIAYKTDIMMNLLPNDIELDKFMINPAETRKDGKNEPIFKENRLVISGLTNNSLSLNKWIEELKKEKWIEKIIISDYKQSIEKPGEFEIVVSLLNN